MLSKGVNERGAKAVRVAWAAGAAAAYMLYESQWLVYRRSALALPDLPPWLEGFSILHISDVHAGQVGFNLRALRKTVRWAREQKIDLVVLTGDILGGARGHDSCVELLAGLHATHGIVAVPGNHEYGLSKNPFVHRACAQEWTGAGVKLLKDSRLDVHLPGGEGHHGGVLKVWGADYITRGFPLTQALARQAREPGSYSILLTHRPPLPEDELAGHFSLAFSGHTHGGQMRLPSPRGLVALHREALPYVEGTHRVGRGIVAISRGIGTSFLPFRLFTRPRVDLYTLTRGTVV